MGSLLFPTRTFTKMCFRCQKILVQRNSLVGSSCTWFTKQQMFNKHYSTKIQVDKDDSVTDSSSKVNYTISHEDFKWVRQLLPPSVIPDPPKHDKYPTPSGWTAPAETIPDLPYFVDRSRYHQLPVYLVVRRTSRYTKVARVEGDIWALEKELIELVRPTLQYDPATRVHEVSMAIFIKGDHVKLIEDFLLEKGF